MNRRPTVLALIVAACLAAACDAADDAPPSAQQTQTPAAGEPAATSFDTARAFLVASGDTIPLRVEIAERADQRAFGLMDRDSLADDAGMIFLYEQQQPGTAGFWMYRTRIPLDIAFLDGAGRIVAIRHMEPCPSPDRARCERMARDYHPGESYYGALEVAGGWFAGHGVEVGDRFVLPGRMGG